MFPGHPATPVLPWPCCSGGLLLLAMTGFVWHFLQDQLAKSAVTALASLYGTKYKYGSIIKAICKWVHGLCVWPWGEAQLAKGAQIWGHSKENGC